MECARCGKVVEETIYGYGNEVFCNKECKDSELISRGLNKMQNEAQTDLQVEFVKFLKSF